MDAQEWEMGELLGVHFFAFSFVPASWYESQPNSIQLERDMNQNVIETWWQYYEPETSIVDYCDKYLVRSDPSPYDWGLIETVWSDENGHRVELWEKELDVVDALDIKIDARYPYRDFLSTVVNLAISANCLFYLRHEDSFIQPSSIHVFEAMNRSPAAKLARNESLVSGTH